MARAGLVQIQVLLALLFLSSFLLSYATSAPLAVLPLGLDGCDNPSHNLLNTRSTFDNLRGYPVVVPVGLANNRDNALKREYINDSDSITLERRGVAAAFHKLGEKISAGFHKVKQFFQSTGKVIAKVALKAASAVESVASKVVQFIPGVGSLASKAMDGVSAGLSKASDAIKAHLSNKLQKAMTVLGDVQDPYGAAAKAVKNAAAKKFGKN